MTAVQPTLAAHPHRNQRLFSDHYLDTILPEQAQWKQGAAGVFEWLAKIQCIYDAFTPSTNEAQTGSRLRRLPGA